MKISEQILKEAWELRRKGVYSMREIADKLGVIREQLIEELDAWLRNEETRS